MNRIGSFFLSALSLATMATTAKGTTAPSHPIINDAKVAHHALVEKGSAKVSQVKSSHGPNAFAGSSKINSHWKVSSGNSWTFNDAIQKKLNNIKNPQERERAKLQLLMLARIYGEIKNSGKKLPSSAQANYRRNADNFMNVIVDNIAIFAKQSNITKSDIQRLNASLASALPATSLTMSNSASESAAPTRAQILALSKTSILNIANENPQNVLALLR